MLQVVGVFIGLFAGVFVGVRWAAFHASLGAPETP
jgi:hypothetical protein